MSVQSIESSEQFQPDALNQPVAESTFQTADFDLIEFAPARNLYHIPRWVWNCFVGSLMVFGGTLGFTSLTSTGPALMGPSKLSEPGMTQVKNSSESQVNQDS